MALALPLLLGIDAIDQLGPRIMRCPRKRLQSNPALIAGEALKHIPEFYATEKDVRGRSAEEPRLSLFHSVLTIKRRSLAASPSWEMFSCLLTSIGPTCSVQRVAASRKKLLSSRDPHSVSIDSG